MKKYYLDLSDCTLISKKRLYVEAKNREEAVNILHEELFKKGFTKVSKLWIAEYLKGGGN